MTEKHLRARALRPFGLSFTQETDGAFTSTLNLFEVVDTLWIVCTSFARCAWFDYLNYISVRTHSHEP